MTTVKPIERIQLRRTKGWRKPDNTVVVSRPSRWGNPLVVGEEANHESWCYFGLGRTVFGFDTKVEAVAACVHAYAGLWLAPRVYFPDLDLAELAGKNLACWCPLDQPCHADVLLALANTLDKRRGTDAE